MTIPEPKSKISDCPYCANAPTSHKLTYIGSILSVLVDPLFANTTKFAPKFLKRFVDWLPSLFFRVLSWCGAVKFGDDIEKTLTFRSRVVWEEAKRRGIDMQQVIAFGKHLEIYRAKINGRYEYFESLPVPPHLLNADLWDNKSTLKRVFRKEGIPVPKSVNLFAPLKPGSRFRKAFERLAKPMIVKPEVGSRGRHTTTNINTFDEFTRGLDVARELGPFIIAEEHLMGDVYRATLVQGALAGFYQGAAPLVVGDGKRTVAELLRDKNANRPERVEQVNISDEIRDYIKRSGFTLDSVPADGLPVQLTYRTGRFFGGETREMIDELDPSFVPIFEHAARVTKMAVTGFDCIIPDPTRGAESQKWGIIECNTLPFIDLHYYALHGKPRNIAGMIWDLWDK